MSFWEELKRRNVYKVGVAYLIVAWLIVQAAAIVFPHLNLPTWAVTLVIVLLIICFPLILLFAWAFEITPDGLKLTKDVPHHESITHMTGQKLNYILVGLLVIAVGYILVDKLYIAQRAGKTDEVSVSGEAKIKKTIAVLPFVNMSPDPDQEYFADGLSEELLNSLAQIPDLTVIARTSAFTFKGSNKKVQEIASELGVDNILEGSVRKAGDDLRITAQLVKGVDGSHLWSNTYDRELKDIFAVQEDIATAVADELKLTLGVGESFKQLGGTDNVQAYELYLSAKAHSNEIDFWNWRDRVFESIDAALELDPEFALAWALKSSIYQQYSRFEGDLLDECLKAAQRAVELEPNLAEAHAAMAGYYMSIGDWTEAELAYRNSRDLGTQSTLIDGNYIPFLFRAADFNKANKILGEALQNDPLNQRITSMYINSFIYLGDRQRAEEENDRGISLFGEQFSHKMYINDNFNDMSLDSLLTQRAMDTGWPSEDQRGRIKSPEDLLAELRHDYEDLDIPNFLFSYLAYTAAYYGDSKLALDMLEKKGLLKDAESLTFLWFPVMHDVRQLPRSKEFIREVGLVDYWNEFGWPDICRPLDNGDFVCD